MDINKRFDQLESLLVDLARKQDQQAEQIARILQILGSHGEAINSLGELLNSQTEVLNSQTEVLNSQTEVLNSHTEVLNSHTGALNSLTEIAARHAASLERQEIRLDAVGDQIGDIINILKLSEARHTDTEQRQDAMMAEIKTQSQRQDVAVEALRALLKRQENTDSRLDGVVQTQLQMLQLMRADADKLDNLAQRLPGVEGQEPRIKRLEDEVFRAAS
jgi:chromosome segregation ATPase